MDEIYGQLSERFEYVFTDSRGGASFDYLTGEQVVTRLNEVLGPFAWSFEVVGRGYVEETDEEWVRGRLTVTIDGQQAIREQFGSQKRNKKRDGTPIEIGMDMKGATTDCLKKCASWLGVGLYLSHKEPARPQQRPTQQQRPRREPNEPIEIPMCEQPGCRNNVAGGGAIGGKRFCWSCLQRLKAAQ